MGKVGSRPTPFLSDKTSRVCRGDDTHSVIAAAPHMTAFLTRIDHPQALFAGLS
jgi:hypothetical protein